MYKFKAAQVSLFYKYGYALHKNGTRKVARIGRFTGTLMIYIDGYDYCHPFKQSDWTFYEAN